MMYIFLEALNTKVTPVVCNTLRILKELVMSSDLVGEALVPYYRQILPPLNLLIKKNGKCYFVLTSYFN